MGAKPIELHIAKLHKKAQPAMATLTSLHGLQQGTISS